MFSKKDFLQQQKQKWVLAEWVVKHFPSHECYVEPFGGSCSVLMNKMPSDFEVYNDRDSDIVTLFNVLRDDEMRTDLLRLLVMTPYSRTEFDFAQEYSAKFSSKRRGGEVSQSAVMIAHQLLVRSYMSITKLDAINGIGFRADTSKIAPSVKELWNDLPDELIRVTERFRQVIVENTDAFNVIKAHDRKDTLFYLDPPNILNKGEYTDLLDRNKMHINVFDRLMKLINKSCGMFVLNAYDNEFYNDTLVGWRKKVASKPVGNNKSKITSDLKCLWLSPECSSDQLEMFAQL